MLRRLLGENIELQLSLDPQAGAFRADPGQMGQVLMNLAVNAKDAMPSGGKLLIETSNHAINDHFGRSNVYVPPGQYVVLTITDTGTGMNAEVQSHLFEPFYTTKEQGKGTGLGLSTVYGIVVNQSNGSIGVTSDPGQGTSFKLYFPSLALEPSVVPDRRAGRASGRGETILLAEDEAGVRKYTRDILVRYGYTVLEAANGADALAVARSHPGMIHLLLTDIIMPMMGGVELAEKFNAEFPGIPVLFMSGYTDQIMRHWDVLSAYIQKPYNLSDLLTQVRELLDGTSRDSLPAEDLPAAG
jgi:CheY-like chemotaxis protein